MNRRTIIKSILPAVFSPLVMPARGQSNGSSPNTAETDQLIRDEFRQQEIVIVSNWHLSKTEAALVSEQG